MKTSLYSGKPYIYTYMFVAYVLLFILVSYPSLTYNVASSHMEPVVVPTFFMLVSAYVSLHMPLILPRLPLLLTLTIHFKEHIFWKAALSLTPTHGYVLLFVHLLNPIFSLKQFSLTHTHTVLLFSYLFSRQLLSKLLRLLTPKL